MASVEQLPDPSDRSKPWLGDEPAYLAWYRHLQEHSDADRVWDQIERHKLIRNYAEAVPIPDALVALERLGPLLEIGSSVNGHRDVPVGGQLISLLADRLSPCARSVDLLLI